MKIKLLVIHEEEGVCDFIKKFLQERGLEVFWALSGKEALEIFKRERPQIILLDDWMREMTSLDILRQIKEIDYHNYVFIFTKDIFDNLEMLTKAMALGAKNCIRKPILLEDLEDRIMPIVERIKQNKGGKADEG